MTALRPTNHTRAAGFASAASLAVFVFIEQSANAILQAFPGVFVPLAIVWDIALWAWTVGFAITVFGASSGASMRAARLAATVALVTPGVLAYGQLAGSFTTLVPIAYLVIFVSVGVAMVLKNFHAGRIGGLSRAQAGLGAVAGAAYILGGLGGIGFLGTPLLVALAAVGLQVLMLAHALYIAWALWLGVRPAQARTQELALT